MILLLTVLACVPKGAAETDQPGDLAAGEPEITAVSWACDVDAAEWSFTVDTARWSAGAWLWLATDVDTWERHPVYSRAAARDGSTDQLGAELEIVADWRDVSTGSSTRFRCQEVDAMAFQLTIYDREGDEETDCRRWGVELFDSLEDVPDCTVWLEASGDTGS